MATPARVLRPTLEEAEDAIVAALRADATIAAYKPDVIPWQGTLEQAVAEAGLRSPSILVLFAGGELEERGPLEQVLSVEWHVIVRCRNLRGESYRRKPASASEVGSYQMVQDVLRVLAVQDLGLEGMSPLLPGTVDLLQSTTSKDRAQSAYTVVFTSELDHVVVAPEEALELTEATYQVRNEGADTWPTVATDSLTPEEG